MEITSISCVWRRSFCIFILTEKIALLSEKGCIHVVNYNLREVSVYFKTRGGVFDI
jgi:hypothetical protein